jgi:hypothetical protein
MTATNVRLAIHDELRMAAEFGRAAELLAEKQMFGNAISRLYYQAFHHVRALLLTKSLEPKTHEGIHRLFGLHFVKPGIFKPEESVLLGRLMKYRETADYDPVSTFTHEDFQNLKDFVHSLCEHVQEYLRAEKYL